MEETMKDYERELEESYKELEADEEPAVLTEEEEAEQNAWTYLKELMATGQTVKMKAKEAVPAGLIGTVEGIRAFMPVSKITSGRVENTDDWVGKTIEAEIITLDKENKKLVLSGRAVAEKKEAVGRAEKLKEIKVGDIVEGVVETIQPYGAFVKLENGLTGLVHVSQVCGRRIKTPAEVLKTGQSVRAKITKLEGDRISLSMKVLEEFADPDEEPVDVEKYSSGEAFGTNLGDILAKLKH